MNIKLQSISPEYLNQAKTAFDIAKTKMQLDQAKAKYLGTKSILLKELKQLPSMSREDKAKAGRLLNARRSELNDIYLNSIDKNNKSHEKNHIDLSRPYTINEYGYGHEHPTSKVLAQTYDIFTELGFAIVDSDEIETDWYNFEALNMPKEHPARDMQDTFYIESSSKSQLVPRTHTSGSQVRFMENNKPPYKIIVPGRVFRNEDEDPTHIWSFYQVEGLVVGEGVTMSDLKGTLLHVVKELLGQDVELRFRASYFPYTEPSVEIDCKYKNKWLELGGAGMVHPQVLINGGVDPEIFSGFAFGWGAERIANIKYGLNDLRELWRPRFSFLEQF